MMIISGNDSFARADLEVDFQAVRGEFIFMRKEQVKELVQANWKAFVRSRNYWARKEKTRMHDSRCNVISWFNRESRKVYFAFESYLPSRTVTRVFSIPFSERKAFQKIVTEIIKISK